MGKQSTISRIACSKFSRGQLWQLPVCIPLAVEQHYGACSSHLSPGHRAQRSHKGLLPTRASSGMQQMIRTLMFCKIVCLFIFTVKSRTNFFQIPKAKPSYSWLCELCLKKSCYLQRLVSKAWKLELALLFFSPLEKRSWNNQK